MAGLRQARRGNLATMVGSGLAVVAAGSLLAFSTLAEQAGLEGLAAGRLQPAIPGRTGSGGHVITVPAPPSTSSGDPREALAELVRESTRPPRVETPAPPVAADPPPPEKPERERPRRIDDAARVAVIEPAVEEEPDTGEWDGPPYGHAYGHYKNKHKEPNPAKKHEPKTRSSDQPVYARTANAESPSKPPKGSRLQKVKKVKEAEGHGNGNAKGHSKHAHKGKGKGHSKHGG